MIQILSNIKVTVVFSTNYKLLYCTLFVNITDFSYLVFQIYDKNDNLSTSFHLHATSLRSSIIICQIVYALTVLLVFV